MEARGLGKRGKKFPGGLAEDYKPDRRCWTVGILVESGLQGTPADVWVTFLTQAESLPDKTEAGCPSGNDMNQRTLLP